MLWRIIVFTILSATLTRAAEPTVAPEIPAGLGVNIHFTSPKPGEMEQLASAGFKFIRMDFTWGLIEQKKGEYDFSPYDKLMNALKPHGIRAIFILDYSNHFYDDDLSPHTDAGRKAFAKWAVAGAKHFRNRGILWEMYNEPNIHFWRPKPNTDDYIKLAIEVGEAFRKNVPDETYIGPASSTFDRPFLEACFKAGLLEHWSAVSVHPYRSREPESAAEDYAKLRAMIAKYAPKNKSIPILSGEWGFTTQQIDETRQGNYLARQWLTNLANDVPLSIWYDWHDDGTDPNEPEHHFGTVTNDYKPKPSFLAAKTLTTQLRGFQFNKQISQNNPDDYVLVFTKGDAIKLAAWTTSKPHQVFIPATDGEFDVVSHADEKPSKLQADETGLALLLKQSPQYITPSKPNEVLSKVAAIKRAPLDVFVKRAEAKSAIAAETIGKFEVAQPTHVTITNPLHVTVLPSTTKNRLRARIENPSGEAFNGTLVAGSAKQPVNIPAGKTHLFVECATAAKVSLLEADGAVAATASGRFVSIDFSADTFDVHAEGDKEVASTQSLTVSPAQQRPSVRLTYEFNPGWKYLCVAPIKRDALKVEGKPRYFGLWIKGDGSQNLTRMRFVDSTGQFFQPDGDKLDFTDWRFVKFDLHNANGFWGGAKDGDVHYPIRLNTILLVDCKSKSTITGSVDISSPVLIYED